MPAQAWHASCFYPDVFHRLDIGLGGGGGGVHTSGVKLMRSNSVISWQISLYLRVSFSATVYLKASVPYTLYTESSLCVYFAQSSLLPFHTVNFCLIYQAGIWLALVSLPSLKSVPRATHHSHTKQILKLFC